ncbi:MAG: YifB family Mg chelatase-like AAA ATPase [Buchananella hordeovulneris]|nr:YifB family Mg chelatase-like AAA ATPase [Buchananella hordeovulneris]
MALAFTRSICLVGLDGHVVDVEAQSTSGLPAVTLVGLPDAALREAKERVRAAIASIRIGWKEMRTTVNLSPAGLPKAGTAFDLALAVAMLGSQGLVRLDRARDVVHLGEVGLDGRLLPVRGVLPAVRAALSHGFHKVMVPVGNAQEAGLLPGVEVIAMEHLADVATHYGGRPKGRPLRAETPQEGSGQVGAAAGAEKTEEAGAAGAVDVVGAGVSGASGAGARVASVPGAPDLAEVVGQKTARLALEVAAAGGHHLLLVGSPGAGKTMLAERLPGIMPPLTGQDVLDATALHSLAGRLGAPRLLSTPPFQAPHHTATLPAILGGGSGLPRPGAVSLAHAGVLFLDEAPEFAARVLDCLRQPMESGSVTLHRSAGTATYPARFQLVLAANPCPCGNAYSRRKQCTCTPMARRRYMARLSGPLLDRIDLSVNVEPVTAVDLRARAPESSAVVAARVLAARERARARWRDYPWELNSQVPGDVLRSPAGGLSTATTRAITSWLERGETSLRAVDRILRVAWTLADLAGSPRVEGEHLGKAYLLKMGVSDAMVTA